MISVVIIVLEPVSAPRGGLVTAGEHGPARRVTSNTREAAMSTWNAIAWFPICVGLTAAGLILSWFRWRRKGPRRGTRLTEWSMSPLALYTTGAIVLIGRIGSAVVNFSTAFVFSPKSWAGVILFGAAGLFLLVSGGIPLPFSRRRRARKKELARAEPDGRAPTPAAKGGRAALAKPGIAGKGGPAPEADGLDKDVEEILRRHGIQ
jgi:hypothetical protein